MQDESFADLLNSNAHVTLLRKVTKEKELSLLNSYRKDESAANLAAPNTYQSPTNRDDSFEYNTDDWWNKVSDESFLEVERQCNAAYGKEPVFSSLAQSDTTLLFDIEEPSFLDETSLYGRLSMSGTIMSPMKQVAMRRPSTILEESTIRSINSSDESGEPKSPSIDLLQFDEVIPTTVVPVLSTENYNVRSYRPSLLNVFPTRKRKGFYNDLEAVSEPNTSQDTQLIGSYEKESQRNSICLMTFDDSVTEATASDLSTDQSSQSFSENKCDQFNDTLEAVDYYMAQGKKIVEKSNQTSIAIFSPKTHNNSLLKQTLAKRHLKSIGGDRLNMSFFK